MNLVLDTAALIYWTLDPAKLTIPAAQAIADATEIIVSAISIWEIGLKAKQGKLELPLSTYAYVNRLNRLARLTMEPVSVEIWLENLALDWAHRDPADRTIVATAVLSSASLVSSDRAIRAFYPKTIW
ncbi:MAG: type II toxin-antitoxin system VapC family toxin [Anaerolineales bacterium]|nr:type II toxin-antitoxin system VapC family toxin [Anaerolineales bacterium]